MTSQYECYIRKYLITQIVRQLENEELLSYTAENCTGLNGFMSIIYSIQLKTKTIQGEKQHHLIAKFMRGDKLFREASKAYIQFANEVYFYSTIMPCYEKFLKELNLNGNIITDLVPRIYQAKFGYIEGLSSSSDEKEACLVMENLSYMGYQLGPSVFLEKEHLLAMCQAIGKLHGLCYAFKALEPLQMENILRGIIALPFINVNDPEDRFKNLYRVLYRCGFQRFCGYYERQSKDLYTESSKDSKFMEKIKAMKAKYYEEPALLMERIRTKIFDKEEDRNFAVILQGDYYRNNVIFKYPVEEEEGMQMKMFDFQQLRYASPCLDLSLFMYLNTTQEIRKEMWSCLLETYHSNMFSTLTMILKSSCITVPEMEEILNAFNGEKFLKHFQRFGLFGAMICLHFLPWLLCSKEECSRFSELFANDAYGPEFYKHSLTAGGDEVNKRIWAVIQHACEIGLMDDL